MTTIHAYTVKLQEEIKRVGQQIRGNNRLADQSRLAPSRLEEIVAGDKPTQQEHARIIRALPNMRHHGPLLLEWLRAPMPVPPPPPDPKAPKPAPPSQPSAPTALTLAPRTFGEYLRAAREREGWTPEEVSDLIGVTPSAVRHWEADDSVPVADNYARLIEVFAVLTGPDVPRPDVRDIPTPKGRAGTTPEQAPSSPAIAQRSPLIAFGMSLQRAAVSLKSGRAIVVALLREGAAAGLSCDEIARAIEDAET